MSSEQTPLTAPRPLQAVPEEHDVGSVSILTARSRVRMVLTGHMDEDANEELLDALDEADEFGLPVEIDVRTVTFMAPIVGSSIVRMINRSSRPIAFIDPPDSVRHLLRAARLDKPVEILERDPGFPGPPGPIELV